MKRRGFLAFLIAAPITKSLPWNGIAEFIRPIAPNAAATIGLTLAEIIGNTIRARRDEIAANIMISNSLLRRMKERGEIKKFTGNYIREDVDLTDGE